MKQSTAVLKKSLTISLLHLGHCFIVFDAFANNVLVPEFLRNEIQEELIKFVIMRDKPELIGDLKINHLGISGEFAFEKQKHACFIPWAAIVEIQPIGFSLVDVDQSIEVQPKKQAVVSSTRSRFAKKPMILPSYLQVIK